MIDDLIRVQSSLVPLIPIMLYIIKHQTNGGTFVPYCGHNRETTPGLVYSMDNMRGVGLSFSDLGQCVHSLSWDSKVGHDKS